MKTRTIKEIMVPLEEYVTITEDASLFDAVILLEKALEDSSYKRYPHRGILVFDEKRKNIIGKVGQQDIVKALEPKYDTMLNEKSAVHRLGFSLEFEENILEQYKFWDISFDDIDKEASQIKVRDFMYTPAKGEYVTTGTTLAEAIHKLLIGRHQSLLVTKEGRIVGILRLTDVFMCVFEKIMTPSEK